jgi:hypothetical protein
MQSSVKDHLLGAARATAGGQDAGALQRALDDLKARGLDMESLPPEVVSEIEGLFSAGNPKREVLPDVTHGEAPGWAREP